ncbi:MAG: ImpB [Rhodospirillales bacterium]|nr:ImpB [Rhodospirillales bacterium]
MSGICRDCGTPEPAASGGPAVERRCRSCGSRRLLRHPELDTLAIAHLDCDAFYASVEKRDDPSLADKPVIVGGRERGVVLACCYVARLYGVRSAMPMFKALKACPDAVVVRPDMAKYRAVGGAVRTLMRETTPLVEPLSIDEAFLDLSGTELLHGGSPAHTMVRLARRIEREIGVTVSIGLSYNKFLAKVASDLDKPRGFAIIGRAEAAEFLSAKPVGLIWGVGAALAQRLARDGITQIGQLRALDDRELAARYGAIGRRLGHFARGEDSRRIVADEATKSISAETTFAKDLRSRDDIARALVPLCERVAERLKSAGLAASGVALKLKTADFKLRSRSRALAAPSQLADTLTRAALALLDRETDGTEFRLVGISAERLAEAHLADPPDLFDGQARRAARVEDAMATIRARLGRDAIARGTVLGAPPSPSGTDADDD